MRVSRCFGRLGPRAGASCVGHAPFAADRSERCAVLSKAPRYMLARLYLLGVILAGCGGSSVPPPTAPPGSVPSPVPSPIDGSWQTILAVTDQRVSLLLNSGAYTIARGQNQASGVIAVLGNRIEFSQSSVCSGTGVYTWTLTGNSLRFVMLGDPCPGRSEVLAGLTYIKSG